MGYYVIKFVSETYTLQYDNTFNEKIISAGELVLKALCLSCIQENTNCYWEQKNQQQVFIFQHKLLYIHVLILWQ